MKIAVSACLLGENCKYSGGNNRSERLLSELAKHPEIEIIPVCSRGGGRSSHASSSRGDR